MPNHIQLGEYPFRRATYTPNPIGTAQQIAITTINPISPALMKSGMWFSQNKDSPGNLDRHPPGCFQNCIGRRDSQLVPTLRVGMPSLTLRVTWDRPTPSGLTEAWADDAE